MKIRSEASTERGRSISMELSDEDMLIEYGERWDALSVKQRAALMSQKVDVLVVEYMRDEELVSPDYAASRIHNIKERTVAAFRG